MTELERLLEIDYPGFTALFTYRGATAIYLAVKAVAARAGDGEVIVPSTVCPDVPLAVLFAGLQPRFCDVDPSTLLMTPATVAAALTPRTRAIIAVHLFGKAVSLPGILDLARPGRIAVIEDLAQAVGGELDGRRLGAFGDFSIMSFDSKKILKGSGGLLLSRDIRDAEAAAQAQASLGEPLSRERMSVLSTGFNELARRLHERLRQEGMTCPDPGTLWERARSEPRLFLAQPRVEDRNDSRHAEAYNSLSMQRRERHRRYREYADRLPPGSFVRFAPEEMCWRLPLLADSRQKRDMLIARIRSLGALASDHYFPASFDFGDSTCAHAREIGQRALNLWVDEMTDERLIPAICEEIAQSTASCPG